jgi:hypothetical protein
MMVHLRSSLGGDTACGIPNRTVSEQEVTRVASQHYARRTLLRQQVVLVRQTEVTRRSTSDVSAKR